MSVIFLDQEISQRFQQKIDVIVFYVAAGPERQKF